MSKGFESCDRLKLVFFGPQKPADRKEHEWWLIATMLGKRIQTLQEELRCLSGKRHDFCKKRTRTLIAFRQNAGTLKIEQLNMTGTGQVHVVNHRKKMVSVKSSDSRSS
jgi:hypothetical protein